MSMVHLSLLQPRLILILGAAGLSLIALECTFETPCEPKKHTEVVISSTRRRDSQLIYPRSEKEVFDIIGLPWVHPTLRNTDV